MADTQEPVETKQQAPSGAIARLLGVVEWLGNLLPHPVTLFALFAVGVVIASAVFAWTGLSADDPRIGREGEVFVVTSLLSGDGVRWMFQNIVSNFAGFAPLGTVLVALLGVGVADKSGLLTAVVRSMVLGAPPRLVTAVVVFAGVLSNTASEMGYVVLIPLAMAVYHALGRHPVAGMAAAFAGVSGGYSANLLIGTVDPLLAGITEEAARLIDPAYEVHPAVNWYFMIASTFLVTGVCWAVTTFIVEPRLGTYDPSEGDDSIRVASAESQEMKPVTAQERRGIAWAAASAVLVSLGIVVLAGPGGDATRGMFGWLPGWGVLQNPDPEAAGAEAYRPLLRSVVPLIVVFFVIPGFVYGR
ncbi:MAG: AbgT family transporter, partial [Planctomycetota bacterium]